MEIRGLLLHDCLAYAKELNVRTNNTSWSTPLRISKNICPRFKCKPFDTRHNRRWSRASNANQNWNPNLNMNANLGLTHRLPQMLLHSSSSNVKYIVECKCTDAKSRTRLGRAGHVMIKISEFSHVSSFWLLEKTNKRVHSLILSSSSDRMWELFKLNVIIALLTK